MPKKTKFDKSIETLLQKTEINQLLVEKEQTNQAQLAKQRLELYRKWKNNQINKQRKETEKIWQWYQKFILSKSFQKIKKLKSTSEETDYLINIVQISKFISYKRPSIYHDDETDSSQALFINIETTRLELLELIEGVKYGKTYKISSVNFLLSYADPPLIAAVAKTIDNNTIEKIIIKNLTDQLNELNEEENYDDWF